MKKNDLINLRGKSIDELKKMVDKKKAEFYNAYASLKAGEEKNLKKPKNLRHEIAQISSLIREKQIIQQLQSDSALSDRAAGGNEIEDKVNEKAKTKKMTKKSNNK